MKLTKEEIAILAHVVENPQAWADHAEKEVGVWAVEAKIAKYRAGYFAAKDLPGYKTAKERNAEELAALFPTQEQIDARARERLVYDKMREIAIAALTKEGKL